MDASQPARIFLPPCSTISIDYQDTQSCIFFPQPEHATLPPPTNLGDYPSCQFFPWGHTCMYPTPLRGPPLKYTAFSFFEISRTPSPEVPPILLRRKVNFYVLDTPSSLTTSFRSLSRLLLPPTASHVPPPLCHRSDRRARPRRCHTIGSMIFIFYRFLPLPSHARIIHFFCRIRDSKLSSQC